MSWTTYGPNTGCVSKLSKLRHRQGLIGEGMEAEKCLPVSTESLFPKDKELQEYLLHFWKRLRKRDQSEIGSELELSVFLIK